MGFLKKLCLPLAVLLLPACDFQLWKLGLTEYDIERRFADSMVLNKDNPLPNLIIPDNHYQLAIASDLHITTDEHQYDAFYEKINQNPPAAIIYNGDLYNGRTEYANLAHEILTTNTTVPSYFVCGNHDQYFGWAVYLARFGSATYTFDIVTPEATDLAIVLESASSTLGRDQYAWLLKELERRDQYRHCFIFMHNNLVSGGFNFGTYDIDELHDLYTLFHDYKITAVVTGHSHVYDENTILGVHYFNTAAMKDGSYGILSVDTDVNFAEATF